MLEIQHKEMENEFSILSVALILNFTIKFPMKSSRINIISNKGVFAKLCLYYLRRNDECTSVYAVIVKYKCIKYDYCEKFVFYL